MPNAGKRAFFKVELSVYLYCDDPSHLGRRIIECCLNDGVVSEHEDLSRVIA